MEGSRARLKELEDVVADPALWDDADKARTVMQEKSRLESGVNRYDDLHTKLSDVKTLWELGEAEGDAEALAEASREMDALLALSEKLEVQCLLSGEADRNNAFIEIHAGAGGTESCDWAGMLYRMYHRWAEREGFKVTLIDEQPGEQAGIKSATMKIEGDFAFGLARQSTLN